MEFSIFFLKRISSTIIRTSLARRFNGYETKFGLRRCNHSADRLRPENKSIGPAIDRKIAEPNSLTYTRVVTTLHPTRFVLCVKILTTSHITGNLFINLHFLSKARRRF